MRGRWVVYFSIYPSCPAASALLISGHLQVLGSALVVVPAHLPDSPKLIVLDSFYTTDFFGQSDASQVKHCLLQDDGTQTHPCRSFRAIPSAVPLLLAAHCFLWCFQSLSLQTPPWIQIHCSLPVDCKCLETSNSKFLGHIDLKMLRYHCWTGNYLGYFLVIYGFIIFVYCIT